MDFVLLVASSNCSTNKYSCDCITSAGMPVVGSHSSTTCIPAAAATRLLNASNIVSILIIRIENNHFLIQLAAEAVITCIVRTYGTNNPIAQGPCGICNEC